MMSTERRRNCAPKLSPCDYRISKFKYFEDKQAQPGGRSAINWEEMLSSLLFAFNYYCDPAPRVNTSCSSVLCCVLRQTTKFRFLRSPFVVFRALMVNYLIVFRIHC